MNDAITRDGIMSTSPLRILVQTKTHLVPGADYWDRCRKMQNLICQHFWHRDFDVVQERWNTYKAEFLYEGRTCYFLVDHGHSSSCEIQVLWYKWTGKTLWMSSIRSNTAAALMSHRILMEQPLSIQVQSRLKDIPFEPRPSTMAKGVSVPTTLKISRGIIRARLRAGMIIPKVELDILKDAVQLQLLKAELDPKCCERIDALLATEDCG